MLLELSHVAKSYGTVEVLKEVNLQLAAGDAVAIIGSLDVVFGEIDR